MKKLHLLFLLFILITPNSYSQNEKETIDFLNSKLAIHTAPMVDFPMYIVLKTEFNSQTKRKVIIKETYSSSELFSVEQFYPEHINGIITFRAENGNLCLKIISNKMLIHKAYVERDNLKSDEMFISESRIVLSTSDEEVYRIKKAFEHLLKLNGAVQVNDNLFKN